MEKKKFNLDDLVKEIKVDNNFISKAEEIESSDIVLRRTKNQLEQTREKIRDLEKKGKILNKIKNYSLSTFIIFLTFGGGILIIIFLGSLFGMFRPLPIYAEDFWSWDYLGLFWTLLIIWGIIMVSSFICYLYIYPKNSIDLSILNLELKEEMLMKYFKSTIIKGKVLNLIKKGDLKLNAKDYPNALKVFKEAQEILISSPSRPQEIQKVLKLKKNLSQKKINETKIEEIRHIIEQGNLLKHQNLNNKAIETFKKALKRADKLFNSFEKDEEMIEIKNLIDSTYLIRIEEEISKATQLMNQNKLDKSLATFGSALTLTNKMYSTPQKNKIQKKINNSFDSIYINMINKNIKSAVKLRNQLKFDDSIIVLNKNLNLSKKIFNSGKKESKLKKIESLIIQSKVTKIKNTILDLGVKFDRLHIAEIVEKCSESEGDIIDTALEMIKNKEIYAEYFKSTQSVVFDKQANIDEIDKLMEVYKEWEEKEVGKK